MSLTPLSEALELRERLGAEQSVVRVNGPAGQWVYRDGALINGTSNFFSIVGRRLPGEDQFFIRQDEQALVGLVVTGPAEHRSVLLTARAEPGLHGACQLSTTIQSTPSNYERRHGGAATPMLETVLEPGDDVKVLHDSVQYDWGQYYHLKAKRFVVVEIPHVVPVPEPLVWVDAASANEIRKQDYLTTTDLRVALALLAAEDRERAGELESLALPELPSFAAVEGRDIPLSDSDAWDMDPGGITRHDGERELLWVRTRSDSREVREWIQPLLGVRDPLVTRLPLRRSAEGLEAAIVPRSQEGLDGRPLWFPAESTGGRVLRRGNFSAEGGRFWQHEVVVEVVVDPELREGEWVPLSVLERLALRSLETSVELRLLLSLALPGLDVEL